MSSYMLFSLYPLPRNIDGPYTLSFNQLPCTIHVHRVNDLQINLWTTVHERIAYRMASHWAESRGLSPLNLFPTRPGSLMRGAALEPTKPIPAPSVLVDQ